jgi:four helix bundle protein
VESGVEEEWSFRELPAWQQAMALVTAVYALTKDWQEEEPLDVAAQVRQVATTIPAKIAYGSRLATAREYAHAIEIARDALGEVETLVNFAKQLEYQDDMAFAPVLRQIAQVRRKIDKLILRLDRAIARQNVTGSGPYAGRDDEDSGP